MNWFLIITLVSITGAEPTLTEERPMKSGERCAIEKKKQEQSAQSGVSPVYTQTVQCVQK